MIRKSLRLVVFVLVLGLILLPASALGHGEAPDRFFAPETLAEFDGVEEAAYVAYRGRIFDVSDAFEDGTHAGHEAGQDLTEEVYEAGHGPDVLEDREVIGYYLQYVLTKEDLAEYDGSDNPPFVAVDNIIYDASDVFEEGTHAGHEAGQDLSEEFHGRHGEENLEAMPVVGVLVAYELTEEELAEYDGREGRNAFVAVDGIIYDVTERFADGTHGGHEAGQDLSEVIGAAGHSRTVLSNYYPVVGVLVE